MTRWAPAAAVALIALAAAAGLITAFGDRLGSLNLPLRIAVLLGVAALGAFLPLSGALEELRHPRDDHPLEIDTNYTKDDRHFALTLEGAMVVAAGYDPRPPGRYDIKGLGPFDSVSGPVELDRTPEAILDVAGDVRIEPGAEVARPVVAAGDLVIGERAVVEAVKAHGTITVMRDAVIQKWIDSEDTIEASEGCDLGARATAMKAIWLGPGVSFRLLGAPRVRTGAGAPPRRRRSDEGARPVQTYVSGPHRIRADGAVIVDGAFALPPEAVAKGDVISRGDVHIDQGALLAGSIHSDGTVTVERSATITHSVYAEGDVHIGAGAAVQEHLVSRDAVRLERNAIVGAPGRITTLIGTDVSLAPSVTIYGRVLAGRSGRTIS